MLTALVIALISLGAAYAGASWWAMNKLHDAGNQITAAMKAEAAAKLSESTMQTRLERATFELEAEKSARASATARIKSLEEALHDVLAIQAGDSGGAGLRADDAAARVRQRIAKHRADHPDAGATAGSTLPASGGGAPVPSVGAAGVAAAARDVPR